MADLQTLPRTASIAFTGYDPQKRVSEGLLAQSGPTSLCALRFRNAITFTGCTHYGYVHQGFVQFAYDGAPFFLPAGFYFSIPDTVTLTPQGEALIFLVSAQNQRGFFHIGRIEREGRLKYINGCTDSLLIPPVKMGDPCLNLLYFPPNTDQTMHTHPSDRIGMVLSGNGICITEDSRGRMEHPLIAGRFFCIHAEGQHKFQTVDSEMRVLAYHPDSDFGPQDEDHPMINRTIVEGVSARDLTEIHTK